MIHRRPIVGGVVSRMSPAIVAGYAADPLIDGLLDTVWPAGARETAARIAPRPPRCLAKNGIAFVMLNREFASAELLEYVEVRMPLTLIASEGERSLYVVR